MIEKWNNEWNYEEKLKDSFLNKHGQTWRIKPNNLPEELFYEEKYNLKGQNINGIEILYPCARNKKQALYLCKCHCGNYFLSTQRTVKEKNIHSCGCLHKQAMLRSVEERGIRKDLTGQKFGRLIVLGLGERSNDRQKWRCQCDCGNIIEVLGNNLTRGNSKSCGCYQKDNPSRREDLINQRFGKLVVIGNPRMSLNSDKGTLWSCKCDCGNIVDKYSKDLKSGSTKSCGCLKKELSAIKNDLSGQKFGKLTALYSNKIAKDEQKIWTCKCDCGNIVEVLAGNLRRGNSTSCGCVRSKGNNFIGIFLREHNIPYKSEYSFSDCLSENNHPLRFDFCIFTNDKKEQIKFLIEYDGDIHYVAHGGWNNEEALKRCQLRDKIKDNYCLTNNIKLVRINYKENLQERLEEIFNEL